MSDLVKLTLGFEDASAPTDIDYSSDEELKFSRESIEVDGETAIELRAKLTDLLANGTKGDGPHTPDEFDNFMQELMTKPLGEIHTKRLA